MSQGISRNQSETIALSKGIKPSRKWQPLVKSTDKWADGGTIWRNNIYEVNVWRHETGWLWGGGPWARIGISSIDGEARHDWRDFQRIKNDIVGPEWEAIELYPAESRLLDPSNYYYLWCAPKIPVGKFQGRYVLGTDNAIAPQRGWHKSEEDL